MGIGQVHGSFSWRQIVDLYGTGQNESYHAAVTLLKKYFDPKAVFLKFSIWLLRRDDRPG
jgi:hypothetical protein